MSKTGIALKNKLNDSVCMSIYMTSITLLNIALKSVAKTENYVKEKSKHIRTNVKLPLICDK